MSSQKKIFYFNAIFHKLIIQAIVWELTRKIHEQWQPSIKFKSQAFFKTSALAAFILFF